MNRVKKSVIVVWVKVNTNNHAKIAKDEELYVK
jgi:hypothetical protein